MLIRTGPTGIWELNSEPRTYQTASGQQSLWWTLGRNDDFVICELAEGGEIYPSSKEKREFSTIKMGGGWRDPLQLHILQASLNPPFFYDATLSIALR